jgi:hypothetical protein
MPHITKCGKYIFGWAIVRKDGTIPIPHETIVEYKIKENERVIIVSGSKATEGLAVIKTNNLEESEIATFQINEGELIKYKGRKYCWITVQSTEIFHLPDQSLKELKITPGDRLLVIRGSNLGFVMGKKGPLIEKANKHPEIFIVE